MIPRVQELGHAIDLWVGELARQGRSPRTRDSYNRKLQAFADTLPPYTAVAEILPDDCRRFLDRWRDSSPSTLASSVSVLRGFFRFLIDEGHVPEPGPMARIRRPRRLRAEDLDVVTISSGEAARLLEACESWQELLCLAVALYTGRRRAALNAALRRDVDLVRGLIRFRLEKGGKTIEQPLPAELAAIITAADQAGVWGSPTSYLIPNRRPAAMRRQGLRSDKVIWLTVKRVAERARVHTHVHALRAAFAVRFDDQNHDDVLALKDLLGHSRLETTLLYLRRRDKAARMEAVRGLSWGDDGFRVLVPFRETAANEGVRPIRDSNPCSSQPREPQRLDANPAGTGSRMLDRKLTELAAKANKVRR